MNGGIAVRLTEDGKNYLIEVPDEWIVLNPIWKFLAPELVEMARARIEGAGKPTTPTSEPT